MSILLFVGVCTAIGLLLALGVALAASEYGTCSIDGCGHEVVGNDGRCAICRKRL